MLTDGHRKEYGLKTLHFILQDLLPTQLHLNCLESNATETCFQRLPVLVFIDGGGFNTGSSALGVYDPSVLTVRGNLVTI